MNIEGLNNVVKKFMDEERLTLRNALAYAGLGLSKTSGELNEIVTDIAFNGHPYNDDRKEHVADVLGEMMFYWLIMAGSSGETPDDIVQQFVNYYIVKNKQLTEEEMQVSLLELMKHVKTKVKKRELQYTKTHEREKS